jgi:glutathione synthase/RimK-type ligase-like ATP-grasp enzyme
MPHVLLLSIASLPHRDLDSPLLVTALAERGIGSTVVTWSEPESWPAGADLAVIRTTWDYTFRRDEFTLAMDSMPLPLANPAPVVRWNSHKGYLVDLAESGVPVVPSVLIRRGDPPVLPALNASRIVLKPAVAAGGRGAGLFPAESTEAATQLADLLTGGDVLAQPFEPSVNAGERSLMFFGGGYSHAVRKVPAGTDFRVQQRYGGRLLGHQATAAELAAAMKALACVKEELLYGRVDLVGAPDQPLVMELELIEPEVFLPMAVGAADRFADAIATRLG